MADLAEYLDAEMENIRSVAAGLPNHARLQRLSALELAGVAALLNSFYNGIENILKQILLSQKTAVPQGATWHRDLLNLAVKKKIISKVFADNLKPYMAFRHFFSHSYSFDLDPARLAPLVKTLPATMKTFESLIKKVHKNLNCG